MGISEYQVVWEGKSVQISLDSQQLTRALVKHGCADIEYARVVLFVVYDEKDGEDASSPTLFHCSLDGFHTFGEQTPPVTEREGY